MPRRKTEESLGDRLARIRRDRGLSQADLAERLDVTQANVSDYERGRYVPNADTIVHLAQILRVSADQLLGLKPSKANGSRHARRVAKRLERIDKLPTKRQRALLTTIDAFLQAAERR